MKYLPIQTMSRWCSVLALIIAPLAHAAPVSVTVDAGSPGVAINKSMWGVFFEDINFGGDGGLCAELVKNRSFEFTEPLMGWTKSEQAGAKGRMEAVSDKPLNANNTHQLRIVNVSAQGKLGIVNEGFRGMGVRKGESYAFSVFARTVGNAPKALAVELVDTNGQVIGSCEVSHFASDWQKKTATLKSSATVSKAQLRLVPLGEGTLDLDMVSLFPTKTWKNRPNGLRADMVQMLADMKPGFVRFPGGCIVEGHYLAGRYQWKTTIGPIENRKLIINRWNDEFKHKPAPDYFQSFGVGFFEFFQMCDDIGAEPLPILNCGMACQFNSGELAALDALEPYIQDALDLIEFANGSKASTWGGKRAAMGHPKPFNMKMLGVGNEQWGPQYLERYERFAKAIKQKYPDMKLISSAGPSPDDERFNFLWPKLRELNADVIDEHCYANPDWFLDNSRRYDAYDRKGPKVFMGEYAAQSVKTVSPDNRNTWGCAIAEAAYMIGLERNADVVTMASYAPLFAHVDAWQWTPNLIWCDNLRIYGTPNYYVQKLFCLHRGDTALPTVLGGVPETDKKQPRFYASASRDEKIHELIVKMVNATSQAQTAAIQLKGAAPAGKKATAIVLATDNLNAENSLNTPLNVAPVEKPFQLSGADFTLEVPSNAMMILRIPMAK
jgi:alpha-L-arabinofuranosidase